MSLPTFAQTSDTSRLDSVVVTATRVEDTVRELPVSPVIITEEQIQRLPNADLGDLLEKAGIMVDRQYYIGGQVVLRGLSGNISGSDVQSDVLMLLNGHRIGIASMLRFPAKNIERVEVLRGPAALQYGSSAMGGVVNVITRKGSGPLTGFLQAGIGSFRRYDTAAGFWGEFKNFDYSLGFAQMGQNRDYDTGKGQTYLGTTTNGRTEFNFQAGYTFATEHRVSVIGNFIDLDKYGFTGSIHTMTNSVMGNPPNYQTRTSGTGRFLDFTYEGKNPSKRFLWSAKYFVGKDEQRGLTVNSDYQNDIRGAQARLTGLFPEVLFEASLGFDWTEYDFTTVLSTLRQYKYSDYGGYLLLKKGFLDDRLIFTGGARYSQINTSTQTRGGYEFSEHKVTPALGVAYLVNESFKLRANFARGYRAPAVNELYGQGQTMVGRYSFVVNVGMMGARTVNGVYLEPNFDLLPQESNSLEFGADLEVASFSGSLTVFHSIFNDKIERLDTPYPVFVYNDETRAKWPWISNLSMQMPWYIVAFNGSRTGFPVNPGGSMSLAQPFSASAQYVNFGKAKMTGIDWLLRWNIGEFFGWNFNFTPYSSGTFLPKATYQSGPDEGLRMRKVPKFFLSSGIEIDAMDSVGLWVDINFLTRSDQRSTSMTSDANSPEWQPGWTVTNIRFEKSLLSFSHGGKLTLMGEIYNAFDVYYESYPTYPLPGRGFFLGLRYNYQ
ncbi:MAG: TonB-dependent receptor [Deltaproteobacteria bacterium]|jgi:vitamin B12 transporter|nr:TonB-dependent receptor [Deltaproteobacteria bacterium]